jgi:hypothetical protein
MGHDHSHDWRPVPILPYRDAAVTAAFWTSLGFRVVDASPDATAYLIAVRDGAELHFQSDPDLDPAVSRAACYVHVPDAAAVHAEWSVLGLPAEGLGSLATPEVKPWGLLEAWVTDPDGTVVRFGSGG